MFSISSVYVLSQMMFSNVQQKQTIQTQHDIMAFRQ